jgi:hypothetical protein
MVLLFLQAPARGMSNNLIPEPFELSDRRTPCF